MAADNEINTRITATTDSFDAGVRTATSGVSSLNQGILSAVENAKKAAVQYDVIGQKAKESAEGMNSLSFATAGASREFIVLGHEVISGNFSRIPGSLMVLGERMGGLSLSTMGWGAAIGGAAYALYEMATAAENAAQYQLDLNAALQSTSKAVTTAQLNAEIDALRRMPNVSREAAEALVMGYSRAYNIGGDMIGKLSRLTVDFAAQTGRTIPEAQKILSEAFADPARGADALQKILNNSLDPAVTNNIHHLVETGQLTKAQNDLFDELSKHSQNAADEGLTWFGKKIKEVKGELADLSDMIKQDWASSNTYGLLATKETQKPKSDSEKSDEADVLARIAKQQQENTALESALSISRSIKNEDSERLSIKAKMAQLTEAANIANGRGDKSDYSQLMQSRQALEDKLAQMDARKNAEAERAREQAARNAQADLSETQRVEDEKYQIIAEHIRMAGDEKRISLSEQYAELQANLAEEHNAQTQAYQQQAALWQQSSREYQKIRNQMALADQKYELDKLKLSGQFNKQIEQQQQQAINRQTQMLKPLENAFNSMFSSILQRNMNFKQMTLNFADQMLAGVVKNMLHEQVIALVTENVKTGAVVAGEAERAAAKTAGAAAGAALETRNAQASIGKSAAKAASEVYANVAAIPYVGWIMAPPAAAAAFVAVEAFGSGMPSAAGGWEVPHDTLAMVHKDEKILPASVSKKIDDWTGDKSNGGDTHVHFNISAIDGHSVKKFVADNGHMFAQAVGRAVRNNNRGVAFR